MQRLSRFSSILLFASVLLVGLVGCDSNDEDDDGEDFSAQYTVELAGDNEVPPVETDASGEATFEVNEAGTALDYSLTVRSIENVTQAHIHLGGPTENGGVVLFLFDASGTPVSADEAGTEIASGTLTAADLIGALEGEAFTALAEELAMGNAYVNIHTEANPPGEIRGQIGN